MALKVRRHYYLTKDEPYKPEPIFIGPTKERHVPKSAFTRFLYFESSHFEDVFVARYNPGRDDYDLVRKAGERGMNMITGLTTRANDEQVRSGESVLGADPWFHYKNAQEVCDALDRYTEKYGTEGCLTTCEQKMIKPLRLHNPQSF